MTYGSPCYGIPERRPIRPPDLGNFNPVSVSAKQKTTACVLRSNNTYTHVHYEYSNTVGDNKSEHTVGLGHLDASACLVAGTLNPESARPIAEGLKDALRLPPPPALLGRRAYTLYSHVYRCTRWHAPSSVLIADSYMEYVVGL